MLLPGNPQKITFSVGLTVLRFSLTETSSLTLEMLLIQQGYFEVDLMDVKVIVGLIELSSFRLSVTTKDVF